MGAVGVQALGVDVVNSRALVISQVMTAPPAPSETILGVCWLLAAVLTATPSAAHWGAAAGVQALGVDVVVSRAVSPAR